MWWIILKANRTFSIIFHRPLCSLCPYVVNFVTHESRINYKSFCLSLVNTDFRPICTYITSHWITEQVNVWFLKQSMFDHLGSTLWNLSMFVQAIINLIVTVDTLDWVDVESYWDWSITLSIVWKETVRIA